MYRRTAAGEQVLPSYHLCGNLQWLLWILGRYASGTPEKKRARRMGRLLSGPRGERGSFGIYGTAVPAGFFPEGLPSRGAPPLRASHTSAGASANPSTASHCSGMRGTVRNTL